MLRVLAGSLVLMLLLAVLLPAFAQDAPSSEPKPKDEFFSGAITAFDDTSVTVLRTVLGKNSETRTFLIAKETRIEGKLKLKAHVTVRYTRGDDGNHALRIIVRTVQ